MSSGNDSEMLQVPGTHKGPSKSVLNRCESSRITSRINVNHKTSAYFLTSNQNKRRDTKPNGSSSGKLGDDMNHHNLKELEAIFKEAATDDDAGLDMHQFRIAMKRTMGDHINDDELDMIFMKVDTNCDGTVDWDEYLSYMLLEYQEKENMFSMDQDQPFPNPMLAKQCTHIESICRITMLLSYARQSTDVDPTIDEAGSRYLTLSKEGILNVWGSDWQLQKTCTLESSRGAHKSLWVTDMACMSNCNCICASSTDYEVSFYSLTGNMNQRKFQIKGLKSCALTMDFSFSTKNPKRSILLWGDTSGGIFIIRFYDNPNICLFPSSKCPGNKCTPTLLRKGAVPNVIASYFPKLHTGWVQQLKYYISKKEQECFVSGSMNEEKALNFADITKKVSGSVKDQSIVINRKSSFRIRKGVLCLDYDPEWNLIVTGSRDCDVRIWNPFVVSKSSAVLKGHTFAVIQVHVRGGEHQIISVSKDKNIRIWDLRDYSCKQNIHGRNVNLGRLDVSATYANNRTKDLVLGTNQIGLFQTRGTSTPKHVRGTVRSHHKPITCVLYNKLFKQIVTGSDDSMVTTWDLNTGTKTMQFRTEHDVEVTSMAFDPTYRRLATGSRNGSIALWNFNNGACLRRLGKTDELEIADVIFCKHRIVAAGWNKHVTTYADSYEDESSRTFKRCHGDDILSLVYHQRDSTMASASYDGDIFVWSMDTEDVVVALNMYESILPIHLPSSSNKMSSNSDFPLSDANKRTQAWGSRQGTPVGNSPDARTRIQTPQSKLERWLPDYLPWYQGKDETSSEESDSDDDSSDGGSCTSDDRKHTPAERAVNKLEFLQGRHSNENTATLLAAVSNGLIAAWSVHQKGGLLGYFNAVGAKNEVVLAMETDEEAEILITGDSRGYLKMWDISSYCNGDDVKERRESFVRRTLSKDNQDNVGCFTDGRFTIPTFEPLGQPPPLIWSLRGHTKAVTSIVYIEDKGLIGSGSTDCSVRLWSMNGRYLGTFGQKQPWKIQFPIKEKEIPVLCPDDVRRVGSPTTLRQIKGGVHVQWKQVQHAVNFMGKARGIFNIVKSTQQDEIKEQLDDVRDLLIKEKLARRNTVTERKGSMTVWIGDSPHSILADLRTNPMVERTFLKIQREGITSKYLGRINYKPKNRHRESKIDKVIRWSEQHPIVYRALPCSDIEVPAEREMPECLKRRLHESSLAKQANRMVARQKMFGILRTRSPDRMSRLTSPCPSAVSDHYSCGSLSYRGSSVVLETPSTSFLPAATPSSSIFPHTESSCNFRSKTVLGLTG